ncbi:MAG TPA: Asp-tRNA(Asn)/Glu-tRNA(Gln) amidotransferase subunit GatC [Acetobacteraceae bacterium]|nr:Asp-tRNA(Asn)/Glu-tRNA(Gln) amidotransferase subunit GatC [Acetobacteraceae bacterium]
MPLDPATVRRIARLARLRLDEAEVARLEGELGGILAWVEQLGEVDVSAVEPMDGAVAMALKMREDVVSDGGDAEIVLGNAPERIGDFYAVPKVVE